MNNLEAPIAQSTTVNLGLQCLQMASLSLSLCPKYAKHAITMHWAPEGCLLKISFLSFSGQAVRSSEQHSQQRGADRTHYRLEGAYWMTTRLIAGAVESSWWTTLCWCLTSLERSWKGPVLGFSVQRHTPRAHFRNANSQYQNVTEAPPAHLLEVSLFCREQLAWTPVSGTFTLPLWPGRCHRSSERHCRSTQPEG